MKITPISSGTGEPGQVLGNVDIGTSAGQDRKANAKRAFRGESQVTMTEKETPGRAPELKKRALTMKTNATPERYTTEEEIQVQATQETPQEDPQTAISTSDEGQVTEETKPLSPQFAALARQKRALQVKESELAKREEALKAAQPQASGIDMSRIKSDPLGVLREAGVSYDDLTQAILANPQASGPNPELNELKETISNLEKKLEEKFSQRDTQSEQQVLAEIKREAMMIAKDNPEFEIVAATNSYEDVKELIHRHWKNTGEVMDTTEALRLVEDDLIEQLDPLTKLKKIQGKISSPELQQQPQRQMRTLTSRDGTSPGLSRRDRAMAAFNGQIKRG